VPAIPTVCAGEHHFAVSVKQDANGATFLSAAIETARLALLAESLPNPLIVPKPMTWTFAASGI